MKNNSFYNLLESPVGKIAITSNNTEITGIYLEGHSLFSDVTNNNDNYQLNQNLNILQEAETQLQEYFTGKRNDFDLATNPEGTDFQKKIWKELDKIPYGETRSYLDIAKAIKSPTASRAVGMANGKNPISIITPCHRVIGSNGKLTGYASGIEAKKWLLNHEAK